ncbi:hypothetical protein CCYA_CCYA13G3553 [Cyanidiococcus yangmingshanensis]|nr:hypothetical protein CCYA_CCYA13G3553 [Cyanidiococcus yangmingshanensis]
MTSRFFATGDTSEEESSASSGELSDAAEDVPRTAPTLTRLASAGAGATSTVGGGFSRARFLMDEDESDSDADGRRVVKSKETKKYEALVRSLRILRNHLKINDWTSVQQDFDELNRRLERALSSDVVRGARPPVPRAYVKALVLLEDQVAKVMAEKPKLSKTNTKALNTTRQRLRKNNREYEREIQDYRASAGDPWESSDGGEGSPSDSEASESDAISGTRERSVAKGAGASGSLVVSSRGRLSSSSASETSSNESENESESDESSSWATSEDEESDASSEESSESSVAPEETVAVRGARAARWLRRDSSSSSSSSATDSGESSEESATAGRRKRRERQARAADRKTRADNDADTLVRKLASPARQERPEELSAEQVEERIVELVAARGRKGTDRREQVQQMEWLSRAAKTPAQLVRVLLHMIAAQFDLGHMLGVMPRDMYQAAMSTAERLLDIAKMHPKVVRSAVRDVGVASAALEPADAEALERVMVDFAALVERLDDELTRAFQAANPHSTEYIERLRDEPRWIDFAGQVQQYYEQQVGDMCQAARVAARRILHLYYQSSAVHHRMRSLKVTSEQTTDDQEMDFEALFTELTVLVYRYGDERAKAETMLAHVYHLAIEGQFARARDLFFMTHLQENIHQQDITLQIMYNRALAQLGLCAFRCGLITEAHACLAELCSPPQFFDPRTGTSASSVSRIRELLAQNTPSSRNSTSGSHGNASEQERRRQVPFHMQLSTELLEAVHLTSAMLVEVPLMAAVSARSADWLAGMDISMHAEGAAGNISQNASNFSSSSLLSTLQQQARQASTSRAWQHLMRGSLRGQYTGPPENTRDHIVVASKHLLRGDWRAAYEVLASAKIWTLLEPLSNESSASHGHAAEHVSQKAAPFDTTHVPCTSGQTCLDRLQSFMKEAALKAYVLSYAPCCDAFALESQLAQHFELEPRRIHAILSKMIAQGELFARWHQPSAALVVHHRHTSRLQRLGLAWAEKLTQLVENNERLVDMRIDAELAASPVMGNENLPAGACAITSVPNLSS